MIPDRIMRKIERCLALSASANANEAGIALRQAQKLMDEYGLTRLDVVASSIEEKRVDSKSGKTPPNYLMVLASMVAVGFGTEAIYSVRYSRNGYIGSWCFIGPEGSPRISGYAYTVLQRRLLQDRKQYQDSLPSRLKRTTKIRRADAFAEAWLAAVKKQVIPASPTGETRQAIEHYLSRHHGNLQDLTGRATGDLRRHDRAALTAGYEAGLSVQLHQAVEQRYTEVLTHD